MKAGTLVVLIVLLSLLAGTLALQAQEDQEAVSLAKKVEPSTVPFGDRVTVTILGSAPQNLDTLDTEV